MPAPAEVVLNPGGFCFAGRGTRIHTLLGSCVSITLWHPKRRIGGMCHYMIPSRCPRPARSRADRGHAGASGAGGPECDGHGGCGAPGACAAPGSRRAAAVAALRPVLDGRYADEAMQLFLRELVRHDTHPRQYVARIFGGGNQFPGTPVAAPLDVSRNNVAIGLRLLQYYGFVLTDQHLGGTGYRRVTLDLDTGMVEYTHVDRPR